MIKNKKSIFILLIIVFLIIIIIAPTIYVKIIKKSLPSFYNNVYNKKFYSISDMVEISNLKDDDIYCNFENEKNNIVYDENLKLTIFLKNNIFSSNKNLKLTINGLEYKISTEQNKYSIKLNEGKNNVEINILSNGEVIFTKNETIYRIEPYKKQFLDETNYNGIAIHYPDNENYDLTCNQLFNLGSNYVRTDFKMNTIIRENYKFSNYNWVEELNNKNIKILAIVDDNSYINSNKKVDNYLNFIEKIIEKYPFITDFELMNEINIPNKATYNTDEGGYYYAKILNEASNKFYDKNIYSAGTATGWSGDNWLKSESFIELINKFRGFDNIYNISFHPYALNNVEYLSSKIKSNIDTINNIGGFENSSITEFGSTTSQITEELQKDDIVKQNITLDSFNIKTKYIYNLTDTKDVKDWDGNFGILHKSGTPKLSYYSLKKYYENTNGSECLGSFELQDGITAYVYDKDGKPKIIIWSNDGNKKLDYRDFKASDLYGNDINADENDQLTVSSSPIYLDSVSTNYYYQAISNSITSGYFQFKSNFADEIANVNYLTAKINDLNNQAVNLKNVSTLDENKANELMKEHFELGKMIMSAYENGKLNIEYVKLSSMLDYINTIGNSYEDLVTVSAKTRITDLSDITNEVNTAKSLAQDNEKFDIVYPNKIYKFAQDFLDTSSYVLGLEEENNIKTGLINSKALHAKYLAEWSQEFSKIYMKDALKDSLNKIIASNQNIKQNYPNVLLNNEINQNYKDLSNSLKEISDNIEKCNSEKINTIYSEQVKLVKLIVEKYYSNEIKIENRSFVTLIKNMIGTLSEYENLYKYYTFEGNISDDDLVNSLNNVINQYNDNRDIDLSTENEIINQLSKTYQNINSIEDETIKYFNKLNIKKTCEIVSNILEGDIKNKAELEYKAISTNADVDLSKPINKDVTITINLPSEKSKITNNNGSNTLRVTENGEYIFNINIREYDYTYKVTINNIDKTLPKLNIKNSGTSISATATDNNLKELKIEKDGKEITYSQGNEITNPGIYQIVAIDKAGNQASSKEIIYGTFKNSNSQEEKYISIDRTNTKVKDLVEDSDFTIKSEKNGTINSNNKEESNDVNVATGDKLIKNGQEYLLVVKGDITKDGEVGVLDLINLRKQLVGLENLKDEQAIAADLDGNGKIDVMDLIMERKKIVGIE